MRRFVESTHHPAYQSANSTRKKDLVYKDADNGENLSGIELSLKENTQSTIHFLNSTTLSTCSFRLRLEADGESF